MDFIKSTGLLFLGIIKRLYYLIPSLFSDPFDIAERWFEKKFEPPVWIFWFLLILGFTIAVILTYHELHSQKINLEKKLNNKAKTKNERVKLGEFLEQGQLLKHRCGNEREPPPNDDANEWAIEVEHWLETEFDSSYVSRFRNNADVPMTANSISSITHRNLWAGIHTRCYQLGKFIEQLAD